MSGVVKSGNCTVASSKAAIQYKLLCVNMASSASTQINWKFVLLAP